VSGLSPGRRGKANQRDERRCPETNRCPAASVEQGTGRDALLFFNFIRRRAEKLSGKEKHGMA
jgi:hypothetical protein